MAKYDSAISVFEDMAAGRDPVKDSCVAGAVSLDAAALEFSSGDFERAYQCLRYLAAGGLLRLDESGRARAAHFSQILKGVNHETA